MVLTHMGQRHSYCLKAKIITNLYFTLFFEGKLLQMVRRRKLRSIYDQEGVVKFHDENYSMELVRADPEIYGKPFGSKIRSTITLPYCAICLRYCDDMLTLLQYAYVIAICLRYYNMLTLLQ